jgi:ABC-type phosphate transport system permease subunit
MAHNVLPRFNRGYGIVVLIVGILLAMFLSLLLGLPMVVIGAYMGAANRAVWTCRACGAVVDRIGT